MRRVTSLWDVWPFDMGRRVEDEFLWRTYTSGMDVIEVACGNGRVLALVSRRSNRLGRWLGIDIDPRFTDAFYQTGCRYGADVRAVCGDMTSKDTWETARN